MLVAVPNLFAFGFTGKIFRARQFLRMQTAATFLFGYYQALENFDF